MKAFVLGQARERRWGYEALETAQEARAAKEAEKAERKSRPKPRLRAGKGVVESSRAHESSGPCGPTNIFRCKRGKQAAMASL